MVSRMRPSTPPAARVLMAGDTGDVAAIRSRLADCDPNATGLVFIEAFNAVQIVPIEAPTGIGVHWVFRERPQGTVAPRGQSLVAAVDAWLDEWMRPEGGVEISIWLGARSSDVVATFASRLDRELAAI
ncbi:SIP domain-containing protein [Agromyces sp. CF514]|uniref:SIP domain-containing protein n=1 Tax=Agromyces sp. CF514 TaxID=1881031 RepID=UPI000A86B4B6|nr:SIP domain-containing protein [Agromyces sp. CF514]